MRAATLVCLLSLFSVSSAIGENAAGDSAAARVGAQRFLDLLRQKQWTQATEMVLLNDAAFRRYNLPKGGAANEELLKRSLADTFRSAYAVMPPGSIISVDLPAQSPGLAIIVYHHDDLDSFRMRFSGGEWRYSFD